MKKFLLTLSLLLSATTIPLLSSVFMHTPTRNPAVQIGGLPSFDMKGMVMQTILQSPNFEEERANIKKFLGIPDNGTITQTYQTIVATIHNAPSDLPGLTETIEALEKALMNYVHTQNYVVAFENKWLNIFATGVRWNWINPIQWIKPSSWYSDNSLALQACMQELLNLATIAERHSIFISLRMKTKAESYLHWRKNLSIAIATYFAGNLIAHGWKNSSLKMVKNGGLSNTKKILDQSGKDIADLTTFAYNVTSKAASMASSYFAPIANIILHGDQTNTSVENKDNDQSNARIENKKDFNNLADFSYSKEDKLTNTNNFIPTNKETAANTNQSNSLYSNFKNYNTKLYRTLFAANKINENNPIEANYNDLYIHNNTTETNYDDLYKDDKKKINKIKQPKLVTQIKKYLDNNNDYKELDPEVINKNNDNFQKIDSTYKAAKKAIFSYYASWFK